jgi:UDP:flavonoid glycosyltransferase YjiC (YdhE family)
MAKVLFTWELGAGYGHLLRLLPLAIEFKNRGHEVVFVLRNLERVEQLFGKYAFEIYQAPLWQASAKGMPEIASYADILLRYGFFDASGLTGLIKSWQNYFRLLQPDLIVFDHSPTALLAAHDDNTPRIILANGFEIPPQITPLPAIRWWNKTPLKRLQDHEQEVLATINKVQTNLGRQPLQTLAQLFEVDEIFLATFQELDQYPQRQEGKYFGISLSSDIGVTPNWPIASGKKIFAYLNANYAGLGQLLASLNALGCSVLIHSPGLSSVKIKQFESATIKFSTQAVNIDLVSKQCDLAICHSGIGTGTAMLLAGCPVLLVPTQLEQYTAAKRIVEIGAGLLVEPEHKKVNFKQLIKTLFKDSSYTEAAKTFARKYSKFDSQVMIKDVAEQCEKHIKKT